MQKDRSFSLAYSFITPENIFNRWQDSKTYTDQLTTPFPEFQRIARNEPYPGADPDYPDVTDGTTASIIQKTPKRVVQQLPTGSVIPEDGEYEWLGIVAGYIYVEKILPYADEDYSLFEKAQLVIENGLTFGSACSYAPFINHDGYFCPDMTLPYWGDIYLQRGKKSGRSCNFIFIRSWWQKEDVKALIQNERELAAKAKQRGESYESTWDAGALQEILDKLDTKDSQALTPDEQQRGSDVTGIELVTAFQKGVGAKFYTFNPASKKIVRTKVNKDPRGKMPLDWFYGDIDGTNPFGRGIVELLGGLQNLIDSDMQAYQYNRALALQPPVVKYGNIGNFSFEPNFVVDAASDPNAKIVPLTIDTAALTNYPALYGLQKSQLLNLVSSPDTSISADVGNPGFSRTPTGINQQKANISVDDNAIRKQFESWFESWSETAINLYFAERSGTEIVQLDKSTADKLRKLAEQGKFDPNQLNDQDQIIIDYDTATPVLKFRVDASTSKMADDQTQLQANDLLMKAVDGSPVLQQLIPPEKILGLWNSLVKLSGREDPEDVAVDVEQFKKEQQQQMQQSQAQMVQGQPQGRTPSESITFKDAVAVAPRAAAAMLEQAGLPSEDLHAQAAIADQQKIAALAPQQPQQPQPTQQEPPLVQHLRQLGLSDQAVQQVVAHALSQGGQ